MTHGSERILVTKISNQQEETIELPIIKSSLGERGVEISQLHKKFGYFSYDPAYMATASCQSDITYIDGEKGILQHRGHNIEQLAEKYSFFDVIHLLLYGNIPTNHVREQLISSMADQISAIETDYIVSIISSFVPTDHPMAMIMACLARMSAEQNEKFHSIPKEPSNVDQICMETICYLLRVIPIVGQYVTTGNTNNIALNSSVGILENFLNIMLNKTNDQNSVTSLDKLFILHVDHEQNASTSAVRSVGSTGVNLYAAVCAGVASLWGPLHGGANEAVIKMLQSIIANKEDPASYITKVKNGSTKLSGFGHRVYKNYDPRAGVIKKYCDIILSDSKSNERDMLELASVLEKTALADEYFISRKLFPNVDFYSGVIYKAIGVPEAMFPPLFAAARVVGWTTQWKEMVLSKEKINRPRQIYIGHTRPALHHPL